AALARELALTGKATTADLIRAARHWRVGARLLPGNERRIDALSRPAIIQTADGEYAVLGRQVGDLHELHAYSGKRPIRRVTAEQLLELWSGDAILFAGRGDADADAGASSIGFRWFLEAAWRYRRAFAQIMIASLFVQLFALVTPLFFQVIVDKVLVHRS